MKRTMTVELDRDDYRRLYLMLMHAIILYKKNDEEYEAKRHEEILEKIKEAARQAWEPA